jgi:uncharacterized protein YbjT (DUF2867 family)
VKAGVEAAGRTVGMILVTGATGLQGGAVATALLDAGVPVRALVRDTGAHAATALASRGVEIAKGDFEDASSLRAAMADVSGVFSVQLPPTNPDDPDSEVRTGKALIDAAKSSGVRSFVHTSVARAGEQSGFIGWNEGRWWSAYWDSKSKVNDAVWAAGFPSATVLKPAYMMDNFVTPSMLAFAFPALKSGRIETTLDPNTRLDLIAAQDLGRFAAATFIEPERFSGKSIDLAAQSLTMAEVAAILQDVKGVPVEAIFVNAADALASGVHPALINSYEWDNVEGYHADISALKAFGIQLTSFKAWAEQNRDRIIVNETSVSPR